MKLRGRVSISLYLQVISPLDQNLSTSPSHQLSYRLHFPADFHNTLLVKNANSETQGQCYPAQIIAAKLGLPPQSGFLMMSCLLVTFRKLAIAEEELAKAQNARDKAWKVPSVEESHKSEETPLAEAQRLGELSKLTAGSQKEEPPSAKSSSAGKPPANSESWVH